MKDGKTVVLDEFHTHATSSQGQKRKEVRGTTPPVQPSKRRKPSTRIQGRKQKVKSSKPSANQPKNKTLPEVKVDCIKHGKASVESKSMSMQDVDATLKRFDKDYFLGGSNAEDVPDTEEDVEAGIHSVPSKVGEVPVDREGDGETPKTKVIGDTRGEGKSQPPYPKMLLRRFWLLMVFLEI